MKKLLITIFALGTMFTSCNKDDEGSDIYASTNVTLQAGDISPISGTRTSIDGIDSVVVAVSGLSVVVNGQTANFIKQEGECLIDLLSFESTDTLIWTEETLPIGTLEVAELELDKAGESYVKETGNDTPVTLHITKPRLEFMVDENLEVAANVKYVIQLDMNGSLRLNQTNNKYNLQPQSSAENSYGLLTLVKVD
ncbi:DUF4382 domain-containing protein [Flammeovirga pectinis]|uniref:DUF4382 domain-containing protein n=1 Tax=Flammeovirga pectinis TaxID=2494373 RepID=A0A3Q9FRE1_9BACT|nr:DUF4382 domain-containing protein [Flammeovirga pectinis]AZQ65346.1 DUF4382 domain-containing protein [Flammeovirga pectinis]